MAVSPTALSGPAGYIVVSLSISEPAADCSKASVICYSSKSAAAATDDDGNNAGADANTTGSSRQKGCIWRA